jgi:hypothetical protein
MNNQQLLKYFFLFIVSFLLFSYFQHFPTLPDPDSFYHAKMAVLIRDQGIVYDFPWLEFTILKKYYIDHHFLYHVLLVPFVSFLDPLVGIKLATAFFAAVLIVIFYWFLEKFKVRGAFFYSLLLLAINPFVFRINLAKASSLAIIVLLFGLYFIFKQKYWQLFVLSFIYVWTHGGWPLILILTSFYILGDLVIKVHFLFLNQKFKIQNSKFKILEFIRNLKLLIRNLLKNGFAQENIKLFLSCFLGLIAGIIINPYFPKNLHFYWVHIVKIAVIGYKNVINVGAEWYNYNFFDLISNASLVFVLLIAGLSALFVYFVKYYCKGAAAEAISLKHERDFHESDTLKTKKQTLALFLIFIFFFALTLRSRRNVEYWVPFSVLFSAFLLNNYLPYKFEEVLKKLQKIFKRQKMLAGTISLYFLFALPFIIGRDFTSVVNNYQNGISFDKYRGASEWLAKNTPAGSMVFHNDWDDFPPLFYYNSHNHYIAGLDPTFMYEYNKELYQKWVDITTGKESKNLAEVIKNDFKAEFIFVDKDHLAFENNLKKDGRFKKVYGDDEGRVYKLINYK